MYIYQLDRVLLRQQIASLAHYITGRTLDIGSGSHDRYQSLFRTSEYVKMDIAPGPNVDVVGSADALPFPDASFDSVVCTQVFEHLAQPERAAAEIARVLRRGGHALITAPQWTELHEEPHDYFRYTSYGLQALFERQGMEVVRIEQRGGFYAEGAQRTSRYLINSWRLYERPLLGRLMSKLFYLWGSLALWRDRHGGPHNKRHAIGWCAVFIKK